MATVTVLERKDGTKTILLGRRKQLTLPPGERVTFETLPGVKIIVWRGRNRSRSTLTYDGGRITL